MSNVEILRGWDKIGRGFVPITSCTLVAWEAWQAASSNRGMKLDRKSPQLRFACFSASEMRDSSAQS